MNYAIIEALPAVPGAVLKVMGCLALGVVYSSVSILIAGWNYLPSWRKALKSLNTEFLKKDALSCGDLAAELKTNLTTELGEILEQALACGKAEAYVFGERVEERCLTQLEGHASFLGMASMSATPLALVATAASLGAFVHDLERNQDTAVLTEAFLLMIPGIGLLFVCQLASRLGLHRCKMEARAIGDLAAQFARVHAGKSPPRDSGIPSGTWPCSNSTDESQ
jgi:hypothetical protein